MTNGRWRTELGTEASRQVDLGRLHQNRMQKSCYSAQPTHGSRLTFRLRSDRILIESDGHVSLHF